LTNVHNRWPPAKLVWQPPRSLARLPDHVASQTANKLERGVTVPCADGCRCEQPWQPLAMMQIHHSPK